MYPHNSPQPHVCVFGRVFQIYVWKLDNNLPKLVLSYRVGSRDPTQVLRFGEEPLPVKLFPLTYLCLHFTEWWITGFSEVANRKETDSKAAAFQKAQPNWVMIQGLGITSKQYSSLESLPSLHNSLLGNESFEPWKCQKIPENCELFACWVF